jgi:hypothetical protein
MLPPMLLSGVGAFGNPLVESGATQLTLPKSIYELNIPHQPDTNLNQAIVTSIMRQNPLIVL